MNWGGLGPLVVSIIVNNCCMCPVLRKKMLKQTEQTRRFCHLFLISDISIGGKLGPPGCAYDSLAMIARSGLFCYDMLGYCTTKPCQLFFTQYTISCFILSRECGSGSWKRFKFFWKQKHFNERDWKRKRTQKQLILSGAGSRSKKFQRWGSESKLGSIKLQEELEAEALKLWLLPHLCCDIYLAALKFRPHKAGKVQVFTFHQMFSFLQKIYKITTNKF